MKKTRKGLAFLLTIVMCLSLCIVPVQAKEDNPETTENGYSTEETASETESEEDASEEETEKDSAEEMEEETSEEIREEISEETTEDSSEKEVEDILPVDDEEDEFDFSGGEWLDDDVLPPILAGTTESAWFPANNMNVTCLAYEEGPGGAKHGTQNAIDITKTNGDVFAPFTGQIVYKNSDWGFVLLQSTAPVRYADGSVDYMCVGFMHDNDISDLSVGQVIAQGTPFYQAGGRGKKNGVVSNTLYSTHVHIFCHRGTKNQNLNNSSSFTEKWGNVFAYDALFVNQSRTTITKAGKMVSGNHINSPGVYSNYSGLWKYTTAAGGASPRIAFDSAASNEPGKILVTGWAFDEDNVNTAIAVHVYAFVNKDYNTPYFLGETIANVSRPDVNDVFKCGNNHGFCAEFPSPVSGTVEVNVAAINIGVGDNVWATGKFINVERDTKQPSISNVWVSDISSSGYTVHCKVTDNVAVKKVAFPTWTENSGQDDLPQYWWETSLGTINGDTVTFRVNTSEHNGEKNCKYVTHIYAYDYIGNTLAMGHDAYPTLNLYVCDVTQKLGDVKAGQWYTDAVQYVYSRGIMSGNSSGKFCPGSQISRGEFVTTLHSMAGKPSATYYSVYDDVKSSAYYATPVMWATNYGIVSGTGGGKFKPNSSITREQIAIMLYKYAKVKGYNQSTNSAALNGFSDKGKVSSYAVEAMNWAVTQKIMTGKGNGKIDPQGYATRAECASMIKSFLLANYK